MTHLVFVFVIMYYILGYDIVRITPLSSTLIDVIFIPGFSLSSRQYYLF